MKQLSLFDICANNHGGNAESKDAHASLSGVSTQLRDQVFSFIQSCGSRGATCDEIEISLGLSHQTASARCSELKERKLVRIGEKRKTRSGRSAAALVVDGGRCNFWDV